MYKILLELYKGERLTADGLVNAVAKSWINEEQKEVILNSK